MRAAQVFIIVSACYAMLTPNGPVPSKAQAEASRVSTAFFEKNGAKTVFSDKELTPTAQLELEYFPPAPKKLEEYEKEELHLLKASLRERERELSDKGEGGKDEKDEIELSDGTVVENPKILKGLSF